MGRNHAPRNVPFAGPAAFRRRSRRRANRRAASPAGTPSMSSPGPAVAASIAVGSDRLEGFFHSGPARRIGHARGCCQPPHGRGVGARRRPHRQLASACHGAIFEISVRVRMVSPRLHNASRSPFGTLATDAVPSRHDANPANPLTNRQISAAPAVELTGSSHLGNCHRFSAA